MTMPLPENLYTFAELNSGFDPRDDLGYTLTFDFGVFRSFVLDGAAFPASRDVRRAQAEHDAFVGDALRRFLAGRKQTLVGIMGGHSVLRDSAAYLDIARLARHLAEEGYLVVTGGGPGVMEAAHFGVAFSGYADQTMLKALAMLAKVPDSPALDDVIDANGEIVPAKKEALKIARDWIQVAKKARDLAPADLPVSLAIPTWLYGAEPTMPFATHYVKYFQNSIREEALISNSRAGIVYGRGGGGTLREIFQDVELNYYAKTADAFTPMIFFDAEHYWEREADIDENAAKIDRPGIKLDVAVPHILKAARYGRHENRTTVEACLAKIHFTTDLAEIDAALARHGPAAVRNLEFALAAEPLMVTTTRINRAWESAGYRSELNRVLPGGVENEGFEARREGPRQGRSRIVRGTDGARHGRSRPSRTARLRDQAGVRRETRPVA